MTALSMSKVADLDSRSKGMFKGPHAVIKKGGTRNAVLGFLHFVLP